MNKKVIRLTICSITISVLMLPSFTAGQQNDSAVERHIESNLKYNNVPRSLRPLLVERLQLFVDYQHAKQWDKMAELLADFHFAFPGRQKVKYTDDERKQIVETIEKQGIKEFKLEAITFSTQNLGVPLSKQEWDLYGCAQYELNGKSVKGQAQIRTYCQNRKWVFGWFAPYIKQDDSTPTPCENAWYNKSDK